MKPIRVCAYEDTGLVMMALIEDNQRQPLTQAGVTGIMLNVYDKADQSLIGASPYTLTVANVIFDTLQTPANSAWTLDKTGVNFIYNSEPGQLPEPSKTYVFEFRFTPVSGQPFNWVVEVETLPLHAS